MYDKGKILTGLLIFVGLLGFPIWYNTAGGKTGSPELEKPKGEKCVKDTQYMKNNHMRLLDQWRDCVAREGMRKMKGSDYEMSLTKTCLNCHSKTAFCDKCHEYSGVSEPFCWNCHIDPKEAK